VTLRGKTAAIASPAIRHKRLAELFREIGEQVRLRAQSDAAGVQLMLERLQTILFEMKVGERVRSARCASEGSEE
jgi:hypothetical protein